MDNLPSVRGKARELILNAGDVSIDLDGSLIASDQASVDAAITSAAGDVDVQARAGLLNHAAQKS